MRRLLLRSGRAGQRLLVVFTESLGVGLAVRIKELLTALLPRRFEFRRRDVPVRPTFHDHGAQVLTELFYCRPTEEPISVIDLVDDEAGREYDHMRDHRIVRRIGVFGDVEILLNYAPRIREERPMRADAAAKFVGLYDVVGADRNQPAITNLHFAVKLDKSLSLPTILRAVAAAAQDDDHRILSLQLRELSALCGVV